MDIVLHNGTIVLDDDDWENIKHLKWYISPLGYAVSGNWNKETKNASHITMHRFIMCPAKGLEIDHINGNKLDNRRCNLRIVTHQQNMSNIKKKHKSKSIYKGLSWKTNENRWVVRVKFNYKEYYVGRFLDEIDAAHAYDFAALQLFGEFANLNFPDFDYTNYQLNRLPTYNNRRVKDAFLIGKEE
jgi:hypothetical protein